MDKFPDNQIAMLEVMLLEIIRRSSRRTNLADALQGLVEIQESCSILSYLSSLPFYFILFLYYIFLFIFVIYF